MGEVLSMSHLSGHTGYTGNTGNNPKDIFLKNHIMNAI
jgi:hypothetical protein